MDVRYDQLNGPAELTPSSHVQGGTISQVPTILPTESSRLLMIKPVVGSNKERPASCAWCSCSCRPFTLTKQLSMVISTLVLGIGFLLIGWFLPGYVQGLIDHGVWSYVSLGPQAQSEETGGYTSFVDWTREDAVPMYYSTYILNLTNPNEVLQGALPILNEVGPYAYQEVKLRHNLTYGFDRIGAPTLTYREQTYFVFRPEASAPGLAENDTYVFPNLVMQCLKAALWPNPLTEWSMETLYPDENYTDFTRLYHVMTVSQLLFGYDVPLLDLLNQTFPGLLGPNRTDDWWSSEKNDRKPDTLTIGDGEGEAWSYRQRYYREYNGESYQTCATSAVDFSPTPAWNSNEMNLIDGSDGVYFPTQYIHSNGSVQVYVNVVYLTAQMRNLEFGSRDLKGIEVYRFNMEPLLLANASTFPPNANRFITGATGFLNISRNVHYLPILASKPHFLGVDPVPNNVYMFGRNTTGMNPNANDHDIFLDVEPMTGLVFQGHSRLQVNILLEAFQVNPFLKNPVTWFPNLTTNDGGAQAPEQRKPHQLLLPICWFDQHSIIPDNLAEKFKNRVYLAKDIQYWSEWLGLILGQTLVIGSATALVWIAVRERRKGNAKQ